MADIRVIELAKTLKVDVGDVQRAAKACRVAMSGPTSLLNSEDRRKIENAIGQQGKGRSTARGGSSMLTMKRPMHTSGSSAGQDGGGQGQTVKVEVRRRRHRAVLQAPGKAAATSTTPQADVVKSVAAPSAADSVQKAVQKPVQKVAQKRVGEPPVSKPVQPAVQKVAPRQERPENGAARKDSSRDSSSNRASNRPSNRQQSPASKGAPTAARRTLSPADAAKLRLRENAERAAQERQRKSAQARDMRRKREAERNRRTTTSSGGGTRLQEQRPPSRNAGNHLQSPRSGAGPRTTIRKGGLTPAQIAAAKAPKSSLRDIEAKIGEERAQQRRQRRNSGAGAPARGAAGAGGRSAPGTAGAARRTPSVAVGGGLGEAPAGAAARKKSAAGRGQQPLSRRRLSPAEKAARRSYAAKRNQVFTDEQEDRMARLARGGSRRGKMLTKDDASFVVREVEINDPMLVTELASRMAAKSADVVKILFGMGVTITVNESIDAETAQLVVEEVGHKSKVINAAGQD